MRHHGSSCSLARAMDGRIMRCGIISSCQSAGTSEIVKPMGSSKSFDAFCVFGWRLLLWKIVCALCKCVISLIFITHVRAIIARQPRRPSVARGLRFIEPPEPRFLRRGYCRQIYHKNVQKEVILLLILRRPSPRQS